MLDLEMTIYGSSFFVLQFHRWNNLTKVKSSLIDGNRLLIKLYG